MEDQCTLWRGLVWKMPWQLDVRTDDSNVFEVRQLARHGGFAITTSFCSEIYNDGAGFHCRNHLLRLAKVHSTL